MNFLNQDTWSQLEKCLKCKNNETIFLTIGDSLISRISLYIHATFLKNLGIENWYRLSNYGELVTAAGTAIASDIKIVVIAASNLETTVEICGLISSVKQKIKLDRMINLEIAFMPARKPLHTTRIIDHIENEIGPVMTSLNGKEIVANWLQLGLSDLDVPIFPLDSMLTYTGVSGMNFKLKLDGDLREIDLFTDAILKLLGGFGVSEHACISGIGKLSENIGKRVLNHFRKSQKPQQPFRVDIEPDPRVKEELAKMSLIADNNLFYGNQFGIIGNQQPANIHGSLSTGLMRLAAQSGNDQAVIEILQKDVDFTFVKDESSLDEILERMHKPNFKLKCARRRKYESFTNNKPSEIDQIILLDRELDWITPFVTPFTYEALLDFVWGIEATVLSIPQDVLPSGDALKLKLTEEDSVFRQTRDLPHTQLGSQLHKCAVEMQGTYKKDQAINGHKSFDELHQIMTNLKQQQGDHRNLAHHIHIIGHLINEVIKHPVFYTTLRVEDEIISGSSSYEDNIHTIIGLCDRNYPLVDIYRLTILNSRINHDQIDAKVQMGVLAAITRMHGIRESRRWQTLERLGILLHDPKSVPKGPPFEWNATKRGFKLLQNLEDDTKDVSYVHSGYCPIWIRLLQMALHDPLCKKWQTLLAGKSDLVRMGERHHRALKSQGILLPTQLFQNTASNPRRNVLVVAIGGITRSELAAIRFEAAPDKDFKVVVLTNEIIGCRTIFEQAGEINKNGPTYSASLGFAS